MQKFLAFFVGILSLLYLTACHSEEDIKDLSSSKIYFFYQSTCPHCHTAAQYIKNKYPRLKMDSRDIRLPGNMALFKQAVTTYNIHGSAGTPLICLGEHYIMGWGPKDHEVFDYYVQPYLQK